MTQRNNILQELGELNSSLVNLTPENVYSVPAGYFDGLTETMLNRIKAINAANAVDELNYLAPSLSKISKQNLYAVPAGYFDTLAENAMQSIRESNDYQTAQEEIESLSPLLSSLKKQVPYSVPQDYFENIEAPVKPEAKVISITHRKWFRYAAAAVVVGIVALSGLLIFGIRKEAGAKPLANFKRDIKKMDEAQKDNLIDFLDAGMNGKETAQVNTDVKSQEIKQLLQGIPDEELKDFQQQTEDIEDVLMTD